LRRLGAIYGVYREYADAVRSYSGQLWSELDVTLIMDGMQEVGLAEEGRSCGWLCDPYGFSPSKVPVPDSRLVLCASTTAAFALPRSTCPDSVPPLNPTRLPQSLDGCAICGTCQCLVLWSLRWLASSTACPSCAT
jgi:hypothetical protein